MSTEARPRGGHLLAHRDFRRLWAGETVSEMGTQVSVLAVPLIAVRSLHASTLQVSLLVTTSTLGFLIAGLPVGAWVDRVARRRVMIAADLGRLVALGSIPVTYAFGTLTIAQLYAATLIAGLLTVFFDVAYQSYLPSLVGSEHVVEGNAKLGGSMQVAQVAGPSLAGALVELFGGPYAVAADALSFLFSGACVTSIATREPTPPKRPWSLGHLAAEIAEGLRFVAGQPIIRAVTLATATANLFAGVMTAIEVVFLVRVCHAAPGIIGLLFAVVGVGGLAGALLASRVNRRIGGARATIGALLLGIVGLLVPLARPGIGVLLFAVGYAGTAFGASVFNINQLSFRQRLCPPELLGRMNATIRTLVSGVLPLGALAGGLIGTVIGLRATMWVAAVGELTSVGWLLASPLRGRREFPDSTPVYEPSPPGSIDA